MPIIKRVSNVYAARPCLTLLLFELTAIIITALVIGLRWMTISQDGRNTWTVSMSVQSMRRDAFDDAKNSLDFFSPDKIDTNTSGARTQRSPAHTIIFMYDHANGAETDIFTPEHLQTMCTTERIVTSLPMYQDFCQKAGPGINSPCLPQLFSAPAFFYAQNSTGVMRYERLIDCPLLSEAEVSSKVSLLKHMLRNPITAARASFFLSSTFKSGGDKNDPTTWFSSRTRSVLFLGDPLEGKVLQKEKELQGKELTSNMIFDFYTREFWTPCETALLAAFGFEHTLLKSGLRNTPVVSGVRIRYYAGAFMRLEFGRVVATDLSAAFLSIVLVFGYIAFHTGSGFIATITILQILLSLPTGFFFYRTVLGIEYFSMMHVLATFLVLGIGADDTFVFVDKWKQTSKRLPLNERMSETLAHTLKAVFNTSFTTAMAFASTVVSPIMPIAAFGAFAATAVIMNFVFCVTLTPVATVIWETKFRRKPKKESLVAPSSTDNSSASTMTAERGSLAPQQQRGADCKNFRRRSVPSCSPEEAAKSGGAMARFFYYTYGPLLANKVFSAAIVIVAVIFTAVWTAQAAKLDTPLEEEVWFPEDHLSTGFNQAYADEFLAAENSRYVKLDVVLGVETIDRSQFSMMNPELNRGNVIYDENFDLSSLTQQKALLRLCNAVRHNRCSRYTTNGDEIAGCSQGPLVDRFVYNEQDSVECFIEPFLCWYTSQVQQGDDGQCDSELLAFLTVDHADNQDSYEAVMDLLSFPPKADFVFELKRMLSLSFVTDAAHIQPTSI